MNKSSTVITITLCKEFIYNVYDLFPIVPDGNKYLCKTESQGNLYGSKDADIVDCVFPFICKSKLYNRCSILAIGNVTWYATKFNSNENMEKTLKKTFIPSGISSLLSLLWIMFIVYISFCVYIV